MEIERAKAKVGGREDITRYARRAALILRPEDGVWKVAHCHADPITTAQPAESVINKATSTAHRLGLCGCHRGLVCPLR